MDYQELENQRIKNRLLIEADNMLDSRTEYARRWNAGEIKNEQVNLLSLQETVEEILAEAEETNQTLEQINIRMAHIEKTQMPLKDEYWEYSSDRAKDLLMQLRNGECSAHYEELIEEVQITLAGAHLKLEDVDSCEAELQRFRRLALEDKKAAKLWLKKLRDQPSVNFYVQLFQSLKGYGMWLDEIGTDEEEVNDLLMNAYDEIESLERKTLEENDRHEARQLLERLRLSPNETDITQIYEILERNSWKPADIDTSEAEVESLRRSALKERTEAEALRKKTLEDQDKQEARQWLEGLRLAPNEVAINQIYEILGRNNLTLADIGSNEKELKILRKKAFETEAIYYLEELLDEPNWNFLIEYHPSSYWTVLIKALSTALASADLTLADIGTSEEELEIIQASRVETIKNTASLHLSSNRLKTSEPDILIAEVSALLKVADLTLADIGTCEREITDLRQEIEKPQAKPETKPSLNITCCVSDFSAPAEETALVLMTKATKAPMVPDKTIDQVVNYLAIWLALIVGTLFAVLTTIGLHENISGNSTFWVFMTAFSMFIFCTSFAWIMANILIRFMVYLDPTFIKGFLPKPDTSVL
jgi:hypothetical protein